MTTNNNGFSAVGGNSAPGNDTDQSIGDIIRQANNLSTDQVAQILDYQRDKNVKFGEAAVALGLAKREDVLWALSQQFHYPYADGRQKLSDDLIAASNPFGEQAEAFRDIRSQLILSVFNGEQPRKALAVVSPNAGDGKSFFVANMGINFSQLGGRTLLVDADMRTPKLQELFGIESSAGLSGILSGRSETNVIRPIDDLPSLYLLPVGVVPPNPLELVQRPAFGHLMRELLSKFDYVIVDTPAMQHGSDAKVIAGACGAALALGRQGTTQMSAIQGVINQLTRAQTKLAGVVMNQY